MLSQTYVLPTLMPAPKEGQALPAPESALSVDGAEEFAAMFEAAVASLEVSDSEAKSKVAVEAKVEGADVESGSADPKEAQAPEFDDATDTDVPTMLVASPHKKASLNPEKTPEQAADEEVAKATGLADVAGVRVGGGLISSSLISSGAFVQEAVSGRMGRPMPTGATPSALHSQQTQPSLSKEQPGQLVTLPPAADAEMPSSPDTLRAMHGPIGAERIGAERIPLPVSQEATVTAVKAAVKATVKAAVPTKQGSPAAATSTPEMTAKMEQVASQALAKGMLPEQPSSRILSKFEAATGPKPEQSISPSSASPQVAKSLSVSASEPLQTGQPAPTDARLQKPEMAQQMPPQNQAQTAAQQLVSGQYAQAFSGARTGTEAGLGQAELSPTRNAREVSGREAEAAAALEPMKQVVQQQVLGKVAAVSQAPLMAGVREALEAISHSTQNQIEIRLNPKELGKLRFTMVPLEGQMLVQVSAERPEVLEGLRRHIELLSEELRAFGYEDAKFEFSQEQQQADSQQTSGEERALLGASLEQAASDTTAAQSRQWSLSSARLDIRI